jgi:hypothetical protein
MTGESASSAPAETVVSKTRLQTSAACFVKEIMESSLKNAIEFDRSGLRGGEYVVAAFSEA